MGSGGGRWGGELSDPESSRTPGERPRDGDFEPFAVHRRSFRRFEWKNQSELNNKPLITRSVLSITRLQNQKVK